MARTKQFSFLLIVAILGAAPLTLVDAASPACSSGPYSLLVQALSTIPAAQSFCTSRAPIPHVTQTVTASATTITETTFTVTETAPATTITASTSTSVTTSITTTTSLYTTTTFCPSTSGLRKNRKRASSQASASSASSASNTSSTTKSTAISTTKPYSTTKASSTTAVKTTGAPLSSQLSALSAMVASDISTFCSCVEATITDTITTTPTATYTPTMTTTPTSTVVATTITTFVSTATTSSTVTATATDGQTVLSSGRHVHTYVVLCDIRANGLLADIQATVADEESCLEYCGNTYSDDCVYATFQPSTGICRLMYDVFEQAPLSSVPGDTTFKCVGNCGS